jgi:hypothetical protein
MDPTPWWRTGWALRLGGKVLGGALIVLATVVDNPLGKLLLKTAGSELTEHAATIPDTPTDTEVRAHNARVYQVPELGPCPAEHGDHPTRWLSSGAVCSCLLDGGWRNTYDGGLVGCDGS